ncbi:hypothetical protein MMIC_P0402 [Mariprofundus micogutta]|uniref:Uncharacterized protein n=1 Tax=Mariprofundus micogutta TaxID=1921010 RepID=A0A1L8CKL4_9PROT|nr:hypothetical protein [Mariprofundus micogutta]GAV19468.1 hypothetical protein MMIC_P0402 [Mariprofundus micogutta]
MKLFSIALAMFFALSLNAAPAMADSKSNDSKSSDSRSKDDKSSDDRSDARSEYKGDRGAYERNGVDTRDVRRPENRNHPPVDNNQPRWWPFY